jgi:hypothetical protein
VHLLAFKLLSIIFVEKTYKMQHLDGSGAWPSYISDARFLKVKEMPGSVASGTHYTSCTFLWLGECSVGLFWIKSKSDRELNFIIRIKATFVIELRVV